MPTNCDPIEIDADLIERGELIRIPGDRRRYRVAAIRTAVVIPTRSQNVAADDRARIHLDLRPISRGGEAHTVTLRPTDRVLAY